MPKKILLVEDDEFLHNLLQKKLIKEGYEILSALDGEQALKILENDKPELVLLDIILPGIDGFEVAQKIKSSPDASIKAIPIIILSNLGQEEDIQKAQKIGVADYLVKANFTSDEILSKIKKVLGE